MHHADVRTRLKVYAHVIPQSQRDSWSASRSGQLEQMFQLEPVQSPNVLIRKKVGRTVGIEITQFFQLSANTWIRAVGKIFRCLSQQDIRRRCQSVRDLGSEIPTLRGNITGTIRIPFNVFSMLYIP